MTELTAMRLRRLVRRTIEVSILMYLASGVAAAMLTVGV